MARPVVLTSERLRLEPFEARHISARYIGWLNDARVTRFSRQRLRRHTEQDCVEFLRSFENSANFFWAIIASSEWGHIGNITVEIAAHDRVATVNIMIGETGVWGKGYGLEAFRTVCDHLLDDGGMRKIFVGTMSTNTAMLSIMKKLGMVEEGRLRRQFEWEGIEVDHVLAGMYESTRRRGLW